MTTLSIQEGTPAAWPDPPEGLSTAAAAIEPEVIWRRIESWIAYRWGERPATFIVEGGCGTWRAPLAPFAIDAAEAWEDEAWAVAALAPSPFGGVVLGAGSHYRLTGVLGTVDAPPADVLEAYRRLAEYSTDKDAHPSLTSRTVELGGALRESFERSPTWLARALQLSGAADLLRRYRRAP